MPENRFFEDIARVANGAFGAMAGVRGEVEAMVRQRVERLSADMNLVSRDEFEAIRELAANARAAQEVLETRVAALEARIAELTAAPAVAKPVAFERVAAKSASAKSSAAKPQNSAAKRAKKPVAPTAE